MSQPAVWGRDRPTALLAVTLVQSVAALCRSAAGAGFRCSGGPRPRLAPVTQPQPAGPGGGGCPPCAVPIRGGGLCVVTTIYSRLIVIGTHGLHCAAPSNE